MVALHLKSTFGSLQALSELCSSKGKLGHSLISIPTFIKTVLVFNVCFLKGEKENAENKRVLAFKSPRNITGNNEEVQQWPCDFLFEFCDDRQWLQISNSGDPFLPTLCMFCVCHFGIPCQPSEQPGVVDEWLPWF